MSALDSLAELTHPGAAIRERRIALGWTQSELADRSKVPQADISRIENGHLDARWSTVHRISTVLSHTIAKPKRSLANGARITRTPAKPAAIWTPKGPVLPHTK